MLRIQETPHHADLLAEDDADLGNWLTKALAQNGFLIDWVNDGRLVHRSLQATHDAVHATPST